MPVESQAQNRWAHAAAAGDVPGKQKIGQEFVDASHGTKVSDLPERKSRQPTTGLANVGMRSAPG